ncbi:hypothetical protein CBL_10954 [Carabus blaptoides fortunei]
MCRSVLRPRMLRSWPSGQPNSAEGTGLVMATRGVCLGDIRADDSLLDWLGAINFTKHTARQPSLPLAQPTIASLVLAAGATRAPPVLAECRTTFLNYKRSVT